MLNFMVTLFGFNLSSFLAHMHRIGLHALTIIVEFFLYIVQSKAIYIGKVLFIYLFLDYFVKKKKIARAHVKVLRIVIRTFLIFVRTLESGIWI